MQEEEEKEEEETAGACRIPFLFFSSQIKQAVFRGGLSYFFCFSRPWREPRENAFMHLLTHEKGGNGLSVVRRSVNRLVGRPVGLPVIWLIFGWSLGWFSSALDTGIGTDSG